MRTWVMALAAIVVPCGGIVLLLFGLQDRFIYFPLRALEATPAGAGLPFDDVALTAEDGVALHGWFIPAGPSDPAVLMLHGNAGNISHRLGKASALRRAGLSILLVDYRGYGRSEGRPGEEGLLRDARAAWRHLTITRGIPGESVAIYGESLGCSPALRLASELEGAGAAPRALVLEAPFSSASEMSRVVLPWFPAAWLLRSKFDNLAEAAKVSVPALVLIPENDEVIPPTMGRRVHDALRSSRRVLHLEPGAGHNDLWVGRGDRLAEVIGRFVHEVN